ncbi:MAG: signal peptide peptidase SppA [Desulfovibrio sp.]|jgi:protease-4|nr:signal peptide peptidase SppA [Desulfovibrio sp.]
MTTDEFHLSGTGQTPPAATPCFSCPLSAVPADVWRQAFRRPFRKRRPFVFWGLLLIVLGVICFALTRDEGEEVFAVSDRLALVSIRGTVMDAADTVNWLREIARQKHVKGILARVDSPGGGAAAAQEIYEALAELGKKLPVAVSMGGMAASGGLIISMAGERVFANPSTVTGSIGVRMDIPQLQGLFNKIGVGQQTLVTAPYKNAGSYLHPLSDEQRAYFESVLKDMHAQFVRIVAEERRMDEKKAAGLADGKIFTGREAKELGLVDELGGQDAAHRWLAETTGVPLERKFLAKPQKRHFRPQDILQALFGLDVNFDLNEANHGAPVFLYQF